MNDNRSRLDFVSDRVSRLENALKAIVSFLEDREDIDDNGNANEAMQLLIELKELGVLTDLPGDRAPGHALD